MGQYDALLQPFTLRHLTLRNRIVSTSHAPAYAEGGMPRERYQLYHAEKAKGGIALTMFGGSSVVSPDCPATFGQLDVSDDRIIPHFREFSDRIHGLGAALMCQITHMGRRTRWDAGNWLAPVAPSPVREPEHRSFPKAMEDWDFARIIRDFGQAARRCKEGGLDGVELSFQTLHLVPQFWSPSANKRTDQYGGSLDNRMRFSMEVLEEVRRQVGPDFIIGIRMTVDELIADGLDAKECLEIAVRLAKSGMVDVLNVWAGQARDWRSLSVVMANMAFPVAPFLHLASAVKAAVDIPIIHAQRISDVATAARAVAEGHVDLIGLTRPHMADPHIAKKLLEGRRRRDHTLTLDGYRESGGVKGAIAKTAEETFKSFSPNEQAIVRRIMLRLTQLGEGTEDTRRRATIDEMVTTSSEADAVERVVKAMADARLLTTT